MELLNYDYGNSDSYYEKLEDFDSGCSCLPSSPSNCSDFSSSSLDNFGEDWIIKREDAMEMGQSFLDGGPVLNPYINIKAEPDIVEYEETSLLMAENFTDLLGGTVSCTQLQDHFDHCLGYLDGNETNPSLDILSDKSINDSAVSITSNVVEKGQPESTVKEQTRKRSSSENDHTYASIKQRQIENVPMKSKREKSSSISKGSKDDKYWEKRQKNNLAAKRSREMKRNREIELVTRSNLLEKENADLMKQMEKLKKLVHKLELKLER